MPLTPTLSPQTGREGGARVGGRVRGDTGRNIEVSDRFSLPHQPSDGERIGVVPPL